MTWDAERSAAVEIDLGGRDLLANSLGHHLGAGAAFRQNHDKLFAPVARDQVALPQPIAEELGDADEHLVAHRVTVRVVDFFEKSTSQKSTDRWEPSRAAARNSCSK